MAIVFSRIELITASSEIVGHKSGLALTRDQLFQLVPPDFHSLWDGSDADIMRIRSEDFEEMVVEILYRLGNIPNPSIKPFGITLYHKYRHNPATLDLYTNIMQLFLDFLRNCLDEEKATGKKVFVPDSFLENSRRRHGLPGEEMAVEVLEDWDLCQHRSPWTWYRRTEWRDTIELNDLFTSESLETFYGSFLDQRFIDYLGQNFDDIDQINWRKFEGLTCEFFERQGFYVEIGGGRDDDNIDARIWPREENRNQPPTLLVQCKREKLKIQKVVVKALWADIIHEDAKSGLIVTTSTLSLGANKVCTARAYPIEQANRATLRQWVKAMRTPWSGVFLGE